MKISEGIRQTFKISCIFTGFKKLFSALPAVVLCVLMSTSFVEAHWEDKEQVLDYWTLTRDCDVVVKADVVKDNETVKLMVTDVFKGKDVPAVLHYSSSVMAKTIPWGCILPKDPYFPDVKVIIVFLKKTESGGYEPVRTAVALEAVEQCVRDVLKFDAMAGDDRDKCKVLVELVVSREGFSFGGAMQELNKYNRPEFLELFSPIGAQPDKQMPYAWLLRDNENPAATDKLLDLLRNSVSEYNLRTLINCLRRKNPGDAAISKEILKHITHDQPSVRQTVIFTLNYREDIPVPIEVVVCLDDPSPDVRASALYCFHNSNDPHILAKIKELTHDPEDRVRESAYRVLPLTHSTFYRFLMVSFLDRSMPIRRAAGHLGVFWEKNWLTVSLMLLWPTMITAGIVVNACRGRRRVLMYVIGIAGGYIAGLVAGYFAGRFYCGNPLFNAIILVPPFFMPFGLGLASAICRFGRKIPLAVFSLTAAGVCVILGVTAWNNTLWLCALAGFIVLGLVALLFVKKN